MWNKTGSEEELSSLFRTIETRNQSPTMMMGEEKYNSGFYRYDLFLSSSCPHYFTFNQITTVAYANVPFLSDVSSESLRGW